MELAIRTKSDVTPGSLRPYLQDCGYDPKLLFSDHHFGDRVVDLAAFAQHPPDARSACVAVIGISGDPALKLGGYRDLGAPIVFVPHEDRLQWWVQGVRSPELRASVEKSDLQTFFERHRAEFAPLAVYRAKTRGRFEREFQLSFVDVGLVAVVEGEIGKALSSLVERLAAEVKHEIGAADLNQRFERWLFQSVFWLLAAKILQDKQVPAFSDLNLVDIDEVFSRVASHYGTHPFDKSLAEPAGSRAVTHAARSIARFSNLSNVTSESLAYLYENALVSHETRKALATHSTPGYLVDYIVWRLAPWIEQIPVESRDVFEPACGHAAFLVASLRVLRDLLPASTPSADRREYLRKHLHGSDLDAFALEIARLSLTLADIPNPDGWDLRREDIFKDSSLTEQLQRATIVLANPPFGSFSEPEEAAFRQIDPGLCDEKATELLRRILAELRPGAIFGLLVPQSLLHRKGAASLRRLLVQKFEILEILLFPDKVFSFSGIETAVLLSRRATGNESCGHTVSYKQVRESDMAAFKTSYSVSMAREVAQRRFAADEEARLLLPDLEEVWAWCQHLPGLSSVATISKGLDYKDSRLSIFDHEVNGTVLGFTRVARKGRHEGQRARRLRQPSPVMIHELPRERWMSLDLNAIAAARSGTTQGVPQVLVNYVRVSRGPWRLKAFLDEEGHPVTSAFLTVRPTAQEYSVLFLWALCNSPIANAFIYSHTMKRHVLTRLLRRVPLPRATRSQIEHVEDAARGYLRELVAHDEILTSLPDEDESRRLLLQVDAQVLRLYELPARLERQLLDLFRGKQRPGVPFAFDQYFPEDFEPCFPLHIFLSERYARSTADRLAARHQNVTSPVLLEALRNAVDTFEE